MNKLSTSKKPWLIFIFCNLVIVMSLQADDYVRSIREVKVTVNLMNMTLEQALFRIEEQTEFHFVYSSQNVDLDHIVNIRVFDVTVANLLEELFAGRNVIIRQRNYQVMIKGFDKPGKTKIIVEQEYGYITGKVTDAQTGEGLPGATVSLQGTNIGNVTNINGEYNIPNVPAGKQDIVFSYLGYTKLVRSVEVKPNTRLKLDVKMEPQVTTIDEIVISSQALGQKAAINQQINSNTIVNVVSKDKIEELPDQNAAETVGRLPGIAIQRNAGEGQKVVVRGLSPRFNSITINGERIPSTDQVDRSVDLSMIAPEQLAGIEVFKALTPDKDGDAIGGTVNFVVKRAPDGTNASIRAETGYNSIAKEFGQVRANASLSRRFINNRLGILVTGNYQRANRSSDVLSANWGTPRSPDQIDLLEARLADIIEVRKRYGGSLALDYDLAEGHSLLVNSLWGETDRDELRRRRSYDIELNLQDYDIRKRLLNTRLLSNAMSGEHKLFGQSLIIDWRGSYSLTQQTTPYQHLLQFREINAFDLPEGGFPAGASPAFIAGFARNNFDQAFLRRGALNDDSTLEDIYSFKLDIKKTLNIGNSAQAYIKGGAKYRIFDRTKDAVEFRDSGNGPQNGLLDLVNDFPNEYLALENNPQLLAMNDFLGDFRADDFLGNDLDFGPGLSEAAANRFASLFASSYYFRNDLIDDRDYQALEKISAAYLMSEVEFGRLMLLGGARVEQTRATYTGFQTAQVEDDNLTEGEAGRVFREERTSNINYTEILPMMHVRYKFTDWFDVRAAATKALARPDFQNLVPWASINAFETRAELGNPQLQHMIAWNYDLFFSFYRSSGLFTVGFFQKELSNIDVQYDFIETDRRDPLFGYSVSQPINISETTTVRGVEIDLQGNLRKLASPLNGIVFSVNMTLIESSTFYPFFERRGDTGTPLFTPFFADATRPGNMPGQPDLTANLSLGYEKGGFSGRVSMLVQDNSFTSLGLRPEFDNYSRLLVRWDAVVSQKVNNRLQLFANWNNFSNAPQESFQFRERYITNREYFGFTADIGLRYKIDSE